MSGAQYLICIMVAVGQAWMVIQEFECHQDICNADGQEQFCDDAYTMCRPCSDVATDCFTDKHVDICTNYCTDLSIQQAIEARRVAGCAAPVVPDHAILNISGNASKVTYGETVETRCEKGYVLEGDRYTRCGNFSIWFGTMPTCREIRCVPLVDVPHGKWTLDPVTAGRVAALPGTTAVLVCDSSYYAEGPTRLYCSDAGIWLPEYDADPIYMVCYPATTGYVGTIVVEAAVILAVLITVLVFRLKRKRPGATDREDGEPLMHCDHSRGNGTVVKTIVHVKANCNGHVQTNAEHGDMPPAPRRRSDDTEPPFPTQETPQTDPKEPAVAGVLRIGKLTAVYPESLNMNAVDNAEDVMTRSSGSTDTSSPGVSGPAI